MTNQGKRKICHIYLLEGIAKGSEHHKLSEMTITNQIWNLLMTKDPIKINLTPPDYRTLEMIIIQIQKNNQSNSI